MAEREIANEEIAFGNFVTTSGSCTWPSSRRRSRWAGCSRGALRERTRMGPCGPAARTPASTRSLITFGTLKQRLILNSHKLEHIPLLLLPFPSKGGKKKNRKSLGWKDPRRLSGHTGESRTHQHPESRPRSWGPPSWHFRYLQDQEIPAVLNGLFWATKKSSF